MQKLGTTCSCNQLTEPVPGSIPSELVPQGAQAGRMHGSPAISHYDRHPHPTKVTKSYTGNFVRESSFRVCCALKASFRLLQVAKHQPIPSSIYSGGSYCVIAHDALPGPASPARSGLGDEPISGRFQCPGFPKMFLMCFGLYWGPRTIPMRNCWGSTAHVRRPFYLHTEQD